MRALEWPILKSVEGNGPGQSRRLGDSRAVVSSKIRPVLVTMDTIAAVRTNEGVMRVPLKQNLLFYSRLVPKQ